MRKILFFLKSRLCTYMNYEKHKAMPNVMICEHLFTFPLDSFLVDVKCPRITTELYPVNYDRR